MSKAVADIFAGCQPDFVVPSRLASLVSITSVPVPRPGIMHRCRASLVELDVPKESVVYDLSIQFPDDLNENNSSHHHCCVVFR